MLPPPIELKLRKSGVRSIDDLANHRIGSAWGGDGYLGAAAAAAVPMIKVK